MQISIRRLCVRSLQAAGVLLCVAITLWCVLPTYRLYQFEAAMAAGDWDQAVELQGLKFDGARATIENASVVRRVLTWENVLRGEREFDIVAPPEHDDPQGRPRNMNRRATLFSITYNRC